MKIGLIGFGKMGQAIEIIALERGHSVIWKVTSENPIEKQDFTLVDVVIEFTNPQFAVEHIKTSLQNNTPIVVGTTGWNSYLDEVIKLVTEKNGSLLYASNFSIGVNIFFQINEKLAQIMNQHSEYKASIEEIHHVHKLDSPSGTAITLANSILESNSNYKSWKVGENETPEVEVNQLPVTAYRVPNVPGKHIVEYASEIDTIQIVHDAKNRRGFALGAVIAAEWLQNKKGIFTMKDVLN
jgi:4-hydroxy-tetrahydrodipicolinate reductase